LEGNASQSLKNGVPIILLTGTDSKERALIWS
jgi:hypothetical protein